MSAGAFLTRAVLPCLLLVPAGPAPAQSVREAAIGETIAWSYANEPRPVRYRVGDVLLTLRGARGDNGDAGEGIHLVLGVTMAGMAAPVTVNGFDVGRDDIHRVTVGRWTGERLYVLFQSKWNGVHCCTGIKAIVPVDGRLRVVDLGERDGGPLAAPPRDIDGDGRIDFVLSDDAFRYGFAAYAESPAPPLVVNIVDGRAVDVSGEARFRPVFAGAFDAARAACTGAVLDNPNGACATYVAITARRGRFDAAWAEMLAAYRRDTGRALPTGCRVTPPPGHACARADRIHYRDYPDALRHILTDRHYIAGAR